MTGGPDHYSAYGLTIRSEVPLPELQAVDAERGSPDVTIRLGDIDRFLASLTGDATVNSREFDSLGTFVVAEGREIVFDLHTPEASHTKFFRRVVENQALALLLLQRGILVVHASAVAIGDRAVVFVGPRTAGKSTLAAAFHAQGYPVLADDIVGIRLDGDRPMVVPGVPQLRLSPEAIAALGVEDAVRPEHDRGPEKLYWQLDPVSDPLPLAYCYVLEEGEPMAIEPLSGSDQFFSFATHAFHHGFLSDTDMSPTGFKQCSGVVESVPVRRLRRPKQFEGLPSLINLVKREATKGKRETTTD